MRQTEALAKKLLSETDKSPSPKAAKAGVDYTAEAEKELSSRLSRGCRIVTGRKKGKIELEYYGLDDLNDLIDALRPGNPQAQNLSGKGRNNKTMKLEKTRAVRFGGNRRANPRRTGGGKRQA